MKITIENRQYELDVEKAKSTGLLRENLTSFNPGDVYRRADPRIGWLVVVKPVYTAPDNKVYGFVGLRGTLATYCNYSKLMSATEVLAHLNKDNYSLVGNVNSTITAWMLKEGASPQMITR